jgi:hypothetical protein
MSHEYRVMYRRVAWGRFTSDQSRIFQSDFAAERFIEKLRGRGRPDLSPVIKIRIHRREVGRWVDADR